jgi:uncharacterized protein (TIGR02246 family)
MVSSPSLDGEAAVRRTLARYALVHDRQDVEGLSALFTSHMRYVARGVVHAGRDNVRAFLADVYAKRPAGKQMKHVYTNSVIDIVGATAYAASDFVAYERQDAGPWAINMIGRCFDRLVHVDGQWLFAERRVEPS